MCNWVRACRLLRTVGRPVFFSLLANCLACALHVLSCPEPDSQFANQLHRRKGNPLMADEPLQVRLLQSEHLGDLSRRITLHDMDLYHSFRTCQVAICDNGHFFTGFSADFQAICTNQNDARNGRQINLAVFPNYVKGFVSEKRNFNKHALALTEFLILEIFVSPASATSH